jgi:hypothetical protein
MRTKRTTVELPEPLLRRAKATAASEGLSLRELFTQALRHRLGLEPAAGPAPWRSLAGELRDLHAEGRRIDRRVEAAFERIDEEDEP